MISAWWTLFAFIGGGCAGMLLMALMRVAADPVPQSVECCSNHDNLHADLSK